MLPLLIIILCLGGCIAESQPNSHHQEQFYVDYWCIDNHGRVEVVLPDRTRVDCLTESHAIEFDFARKWYEAVGQALYYGMQTGKKPGVVLIIENDNDRKYWQRMNSTIKHYKLPISAWELSSPGK